MCLSYAGSVASSIVMLFPPTSSRKVVRLQNAATITKLSKLYAFLVATWISTGNIHVDDDEDSDSEPASGTDAESSTTGDVDVEKGVPIPPSSSAPNATVSVRTASTAGGPPRAATAGIRPAPKWIKEFRANLVAVADDIRALRETTEIAKWEGSIRGKWPKEMYVKLLDVQSEMVGSLAQLGGALGHLDNEWRVNFIRRSRFLNPHFVRAFLSLGYIVY
jgi:hypothetical protein